MDNILQFIILALFVITFFAIIFEDKIKYEKFQTSLFSGAFAWILLLVNGHFIGDVEFDKVEHAFKEYFLEATILWLFLISAMTFVAYLDKRLFIENTIKKALPKNLSERKFLFIIGIFTFIFSGIADNLTATLVSLSIVLVTMKGLESDVFIKFAILIIFAANAGGLPLITGDITTLMIFVSGKISMTELLELYIPAVITTFVLYLFLARSMKGEIIVDKENIVINRLDVKIAVIFLFTIIAILTGHMFFHLPPFLVFITGLSLMFLVISKDKKISNNEIKILDYVRHAEFDALFFFLGILLLVGALKEVGVLGKLAFLYDFIPSELATFFIGILSAIVDNIPITAAMLKAGLPIDDSGWMLMTYAVGVGGSILVIGSAAGVVAMSKVKSLTFKAYLKFTPVIFGVYTLGYYITYLIAWFFKSLLKRGIHKSLFFYSFNKFVVLKNSLCIIYFSTHSKAFSLSVILNFFTSACIKILPNFSPKVIKLESVRIANFSTCFWCHLTNCKCVIKASKDS